ncbi:APC family permease [Patulibacter defluvii]|uniref:APC family permease n=1 Tax=Patulibacter defluvii TaxID=3095358 RepID=UPI002A74BD56|nr:APC family permease [Patulibacter sp. DM4]
MTDPSGSPRGAAAPADPPAADRLDRGSLSAPHIVFMVIAAAAPMAVVVAILPIAFAFGNGVGTPGMYLVAAITLAFFAVGYTRATPFVRNAGAFYAYIAQGLDRSLGLVAAYLAAVCYTSLAAATCGALAFFSHDTFSRLLHITLPWPVWAAVWIAIVAALGYRRITMAARVLAVALTAEVLLLVVLDVAILADRGLPALELDAFSPGTVFGAGAGVAVIYAFTSFLGFEGTAIYAEEARNPLRTVPRATYGAIAVVGVFYVLTAWCLLAGVGFDQASATAAKDPGGFVFGLSDRYLTGAWTDALSVLIVTSSFAAVLAFHNAASRYFYALARDGAMPAPLARTHPRFGSPYRAGLAQIAIVVVIVGGFAIADLDPLLNLSTAMTGFGAVGLLALMATTSVAIAALLWRKGRRGWAATACPAIAAVGLGAATVLSITNYPQLTGSDSSVINALPWLHVPLVLAGLAIAHRIRTRRPAVYAQLGATRVEG